MQPGASIDLIIVDDEAEVRELLLEYFRGHGFTVVSAADAAQARELIERTAPMLALLDIHMPGEDGLSLGRWLHERHPLCGIVFVTAAGDAIDRVVGLEVGADDYVCKPFDPRELLARLKSLLRRLAAARAESQRRAALGETSPQRRIRFGDCTLDIDARRLLSGEGAELALTPAEFDLLVLFSRHPHHALSRERIMELAHNREWDVFDRSIDLRVMRLRRKIERNPDRPQVIKTVRSVGYMYVPSDPMSR
jgi:two-component system phosphate regulon response regulator OmpR